jgi:predicted porin
MKKTAIAASMVILTSTAMAQNVDIYGTVDASLQVHDTGFAKVTRNKDNSLTTSRIGFRGTEDLGGGLRASFQLESSIRPNEGGLGSSNTTGQAFDREAWVGLSGSFGEIRMGRTDVTHAQDVDTFTGQFNRISFHGTPRTGIDLGTDQDNVIRYTTPEFKGFQAQVGFANGNGSSATTDAGTDQRGAFIRYYQGPLRLLAGWQKNDGATKAAERDFVTFGGSYDFGFVAIGASHSRGDNSTTATVTSKVTTVSAKMPVGKGVNLLGAYHLCEDGTQTTGNKGEAYSVGVTKSLSKRTMLYAMHSTVKNEANSRFGLTVTGTPGADGQNTKTTTVGISHTF